MSIKMNGKLIASNAIKPYESTLTYKEGDVVAKYNDVLDRLIYYKSKTDSNTNHDVTNTTYWEDLTDYELMNNSKALETGEPCYDKEVLDDVIKYKHSTFDKSKFTIVGSPNITDDGIASGFSTSKYISNNLAIDCSKDFEVEIVGINIGNTSARFQVLWSILNPNWTDDRFFIAIDPSPTTNLRLSYPTGSNSATNKVYSNVFTLNQSVNIKLVKNSTSLKIYKDNVLLDTISIDNANFNFISSALFIGSCQYDSHLKYQKNKIDLKQFSITIDGEEVFNGNKTGMDVLKPNNFQTVTTIYGYSYDGNIVYADSSSTPTTLYNRDGSYYNGTYFKIVNNAVKVPEVVSASGQTIIIDGTTYYAYTKDSSTIYADSSSTPTALYNSDGTAYSGSDWIIISSKVNYLNSTAAASNITLTLDNATCDAGVKISEDGIANSFGTTNYIKTANLDFTNVNTFKIKGKFKQGDRTNTVSDGRLFNLYDSVNVCNCLDIRYVINSKYSIYFHYATDITNGYVNSGNFNIFPYLWHTFEINFDGSYLYLFIDDYLIYKTASDVSYWRRSFVHTIGATAMSNQQGFFAGDLDLSSYEIYVNDTLIYQPMLKISYIQSTKQYGSKIVDEQNRDKVKDAYNQGFENRYYTLLENQKNNYFVIGNPTITGTVIQNLDKDNYIQVFQWLRTSDTFEIDFCGKATDTITSGGACLMSCFYSNHEYLYVALRNNGSGNYINLQIKKPDGQDITSIYCYSYGTVQTNKMYYFKLKFTGTQYLLDVSVNNEDYTTIATIPSTEKIGEGTVFIGRRPLLGTGDKVETDLSLFRIIQDDVLVSNIYTNPNFTLPMGEVYGAIQRNQGRIENLENLELNETGEKRLHALKCYEDAGEILTDIEGYTDVQKMQHSTFDRSKFTIVGSPNITDDGIISGTLGASKCLKVPMVLGDYNDLEVGFNFVLSVFNTYIVKLADFGSFYQIYLGTNGTMVFEIPTMENGSSVVKTVNVLSNTWTVGTEYKVRLTTKDLKITCFVTNLSTGVERSGHIDLVAPLNIRAAFPNALQLYNIQSADYKKVYIKTNGVEVFSGNKTGIDTIKPDDYTVVGTPTISADGIASGFSADDYLSTINLSSYLSNATKIKIEGDFTSPQFPLGNSYEAILGVASPAFLTFQRFTSTTNIEFTTDGGSHYAAILNALPNTKYDFYIEITSTSSVLGIKISGEENYTIASTSVGLDFSLISSIVLGKATWGIPLLTGGSIDLNSFKVYVDGDLVYQPCLKIPYTETIGGSKVTDIQYLDRVKDAYEQGYNDYKYFTIDADKQEYTIPMGGIYDSLATDRKEINELKDLSNISKKGDDRLHALKSYAEEAEFLEDEEAFNDIKHYQRSSFDISKFEKNGSGLIVTDDGIASGFSNSNYIETNYAIGNLKNRSWSITSAIFTNFSSTESELGPVILAPGGYGLDGRIRFDASSKKIFIFLNTVADSNPETRQNNRISTQTTLSVLPDKIQFKLEFNIGTGTYTGYYNIFDGSGWRIVGNSLTPTTTNKQLYDIVYNGNLKFKIATGNSTIQNCRGDLKQFVINVDGEEVFNGNQTGIDILKENNFQTITTIYAYTAAGHTVYSNVTSNTNPTEIYDENGAYYQGTNFDIIYNKVQYIEEASRGSDDIVISGVTYYEYEHNTSNIYTNSTTIPTALYNSDGSTYTGTQWAIEGNKIYYLTEATYNSSGNKTITRDNTTVDAGVKISDDGIASGFSDSNYLNTYTLSIDFNSDIEIFCEFKTPTSYSSNMWLLSQGYYPNGFLNLLVNGTNKYCTLFLNNVDTSVLETIDTDTKYIVKIIIRNGKYKVGLKKLENENFVYSSERTLSSDFSKTGTITLGRHSGPYSPFTGNIDLNSFKIYVDGNLIYQPLLRIPYIQSATRYGSKIVTGKYISRVVDAYEQNFEQKYYSLDEEEKKFALPLGELYGLIESKVPKTSLKEVICIVEDYTYEDASAFCWDLSNGIRIQGATQTVSANGEMTVPLLKNFADNHYLAFKNYGAGVSTAMQDSEGSIFDKTTSSFKTSNSTGDTTKFDWIAIGRIG